MSSSAPDRLAVALDALLAAEAGELADFAARSEAPPLALAEALRTTYFDSYGSDTRRAAAAARALDALAVASADPEVGALAVWVAGLAALQLEGRVERAIQLIDDAHDRLAALGRARDAAATQVGKLFALALLGRYDEALACGLEARDALLAQGDELSAGRIELNLGNLYDRRDQYPEAEQFYRAARERFAAAGDVRMLVAVENGLANVLSQQLQIPQAAALYEQALVGAEAAGLEVAQADIECNLGALALFQGRFDAALDYLDRSRRRYAALARPHETAVTELELAQAYSELNLAGEAAAIYARVADTFAALDMRAEQARALLHYGRACMQLGRRDEAWALLEEARGLYTEEGNPVGVALVALAEAQLAYMEGDAVGVAEAAGRAIPPLAAAGARRDEILARWLAAEADRALGDLAAARPALEAVLRDAEAHAMLRVAQRCLTSLGRLAAAEGDSAGAEAALRRAVAAGEQMRAPLPADEIRAAFAREIVAPYTELVRICLDDPGGPRLAEALGFAEAGRGRALLELLGGTPALPATAGEPSAADQARVSELRVELNWLYSRLARPLDPGESATARAIQHEAALQRERELGELRRRLAPDSAGSLAEPLDLDALCARLGDDTALVEYLDLGGELAALVVRSDGVHVVRALGAWWQLEEAMDRLRFQIGALGHGAAVRRHLPALAARAQGHLAALYSILLQPLEALLGERRLVVAPHGSLHYVPFHALYDGAAYVLERREVCHVPSAGVLLRCLGRPRAPVRRALVVGVADEHAPLVRDEAAALAPLFPQATLLLDGDATSAALAAAAPGTDLLHLACHARFRPDSPLFSALHLGDGWLTVHDASGLDLRCQLVTLSACETGVSAVTPGDELLGLARGFFGAGAPTLCVSLWPVDDEATAELMGDFYRRVLEGAGPSAALRSAQLAQLARRPHPFFWASFILLGRW
jgi:tetratricopeptide (TPR) repeat protein